MKLLGDLYSPMDGFLKNEFGNVQLAEALIWVTVFDNGCQRKGKIFICRLTF